MNAHVQGSPDPPRAAASIYVVPVDRRWLLHAPLHGVTALVNAAALGRARELMASGSGDGLDTLAESLSAPPQPEPRPHRGPLRPEFLGLVPTRACNLACSYCGFGALRSGTRVMDAGLAVSAVDWYASHVKAVGGSTMAVHFFGGEPFEAPDCADVAVHHGRARAAQLGLAARFEVATNGCFDERRCTFVADYFDTVVLSLDGPEAVHEHHRPSRTGSGSFGTIARNARALSAAGLRLCLRACITRETVEDLPEITRWFCATFKPSGIVFETLQPTSESAQAGLETPDPWRFAVQCARAFAVAESCGVTPIHSASSIGDIRHSGCPVGRDSLVVSADGRVSACYLDEADWQARQMNLHFGRFGASGALTVDEAALDGIREMTVWRARCERCFARWHCAGGCHVHHSYPGCPAVYDDFCIQTRLLSVFRLLAEFGTEIDLPGLYENRAAIDRIATRRSDLLIEWGGNGD